MMRHNKYEIVFTKTALKDYENIRDKKLLARVNTIMEDLTREPYLGKPLHGDLSGCYTIKTFSFRIIYRIEHSVLVITVLRIAHRRKSYQ